MHVINRRWLAAVLVAAAALAGGAGVPGTDHGVDTPMAHDPEVADVPRTPVFDSRLKGLWESALKRPEADLRMHALDAIVAARAMPGLESLVDDIAKMATSDKEPEGVRLAALRALDALDAKAHAKAIFDHVKKSGDSSMELLIVADPVLARWQAEGAAEYWLARMNAPAARTQTVESAMRALGTIKAQAAIDPLKKIAADTNRPRAIRLAAAKTLSNFPPDAVLASAQKLADATDPLERLLAVWMLPVGKDPRTVELFTRLTGDPEPGVAAVAAQKLWEGAPETMAALGPKLAAHSDGMVRRVMVDVLHLHANTANIKVLGQLLDDELPWVRIAAREALIDRDALPELRSTVRQVAKDLLAAPGPHGQEQACFVVGTLHENSARDRLVELLKAPQAPVRLAAIVALRRLNTGPNPVSDTLQAQHERAKVVAEAFLDRKTPRLAKDNEAMDIEISQLLQNMGLGNYTEAEGFMRRFIPKDSGWGIEARCGAIWALGKLHQDKMEKTLARDLSARLNDTDPLRPEAMKVRAFSAVALGRMRDTSSRPSFALAIKNESGNILGEAARWAMLAIDKKESEFKAPELLPNTVRGWFIEPID